MKQILLLSLIAISVSLFACGAHTPDGKKEEPTVKQLAQKDLGAIMKKDSVILIDVRTPGEVNAGYIPGANKFIDYNDPNFESEIQKLDTNYTYVMYCRSGGRSGSASNYMVQNGFNNVYNLQGGVLQYKGTLEKH